MAAAPKENPRILAVFNRPIPEETRRIISRARHNPGAIVQITTEGPHGETLTSTRRPSNDRHLVIPSGLVHFREDLARATKVVIFAAQTSRASRTNGRHR